MLTAACTQGGVGAHLAHAGEQEGAVSTLDAVAAGDDQHQAGGGADEQGVDVHGEGLDKALLGGVGDLGGGGSGGHAGLGGEDGALGTPDHGAAHGGTDDLIRAEGALEDQGEGSRDILIVDGQDHQRHQHIDHGHHGHHDLGHAGDDLDAAEHDGAQDHGDHDAADDRGNTEGVGQRGGHGVGVNQRLGKGQGGDEQDGADTADDLPLVADVVDPAAFILAIDLLLMKLGQRTFYKGGGGAHDGDHPHPEQGAGAAGADGGGHAHDVAGAHAAGDGQGKGLEGGKAMVGGLAVEQQAHHRLELAHLHKAQTDGKDQSGAQCEEQHGIGPEGSVDFTDNIP